MEPSEALGIAAQVAVGIAGFAGVVVVFRSESVHAWSPADKARLQLLLYNSTLPLTYCMAGVFLLSLKPPPLWTWRACSGLASACLLPFGVSTMRKLRRISPDFAAASFVSSAASALGIFVLLLQFYNAIFLNAFAPSMPRSLHRSCSPSSNSCV